jgi:hypothetical protein
MHFGLYLKNKRIITADELVAAAEIQLSSLTRIGQLALEESLVSPRDIFEILRAQSETPTQRFGELAIEMGLLTREELIRLLMIQADRKRSIADILISQGVLTQERVAEEMGKYRQLIAKRRNGSIAPSKVLAAVRRQKSNFYVPNVTAAV